jgi:hypothetical protein
MAYELSKLAEKMKSKGLEVAEDAAQVALDAVVEWVQEGAVESANKVDDVIVPLMAALKPMADQAIDKIDGEVG